MPHRLWAAAPGACLYGNAVLATTGGHGRAGCTTEHRASEQSALYHKKPLCVRRTSCPAVSECGVSTHSIQTSPRSRRPQPMRHALPDPVADGRDSSPLPQKKIGKDDVADGDSFSGETDPAVASPQQVKSQILFQHFAVYFATMPKQTLELSSSRPTPVPRRPPPYWA